VTANIIDCFNTRLDEFWNSQDVKFDYKQNLTGLHNLLPIVAQGTGGSKCVLNVSAQ